MGKKSTKQTQTSNQVSNQTSSPTILNQNLSSGLNDYLKSLNEFAQNTQGSDLVAGPSALQQQAFGNASNLGTSPLYGQAAGLAGQAGNAGANTYNPASSQAATVGDLNTSQGSSLMDGLSQYLGEGSSYTQGVTNAFLGDFDQAAGQTRAAQAAQAAANGAFGGSRYGIQEAQTEGELSRARASGLAGILQGGYDRALAAAGQDASLSQNNNQFNASTLNQGVMQNAANQQQTNLANQSAQNQAGQFNAGQQDSALARQLQAAGLLGSLGSQMSSDQRANIGLQGQLGGIQRDIEQAQATGDLSLLQAMGQLYGYNPALFTGQNTSGTSSGTSTGTTTQNPGLLGSIGQGAQTASSLAALFSDPSLKENVSRLTTRMDGLTVYAYNYIWSPDRVEGLMADEVEAVYPDAVSRIGHLMAVDYLGVPNV